MKLTGEQRKQIAIEVLDEIREIEVDELVENIKNNPNGLFNILSSSITSDRVLTTLCILKNDYKNKILKDIEIEKV